MQKRLTKFCSNFEFGTMQRGVNLVDLEKCSKISICLQKSAFIDSISVLLENESRKWKNDKWISWKCLQQRRVTKVGFLSTAPILYIVSKTRPWASKICVEKWTIPSLGSEMIGVWRRLGLANSIYRIICSRWNDFLRNIGTFLNCGHFIIRCHN